MPLETKRRVRLADPEEPPMPRPRRSFALPAGLGAWLAAVAVAWAVQAGTIPVGKWLDEEPPAAVSEKTKRSSPATQRTMAPDPSRSPSPKLVRAGDLTAPVAPADPTSPVAPASPSASLPAADPLKLARPEPPKLTRVGEPPSPNLPERSPPASGETRRGLLSGDNEPSSRPGAGSSDGTSCEAVAAQAVDSIEIGAGHGPPDLSREDYARVLDRGSYLAGCGVPDHTSVDVCVAVRGGRALGVTVRTSPPSAAAERCIARAVRALAFPVHPRLDVARTHFE